jgi:hypothetical protein
MAITRPRTHDITSPPCWTFLTPRWTTNAWPPTASAGSHTSSWVVASLTLSSKSNATHQEESHGIEVAACISTVGHYHEMSISYIYCQSLWPGVIPTPAGLQSPGLVTGITACAGMTRGPQGGGYIF